MKRNTKTKLKSLQINDRFFKRYPHSKEVYKLIKIDGNDYYCIKTSIYDTKNKEWNPIPSCDIFTGEQDVQFLYNQQ